MRAWMMQNKKIAVALFAAALVFLVAAGILFCRIANNKEETVYKETEAKQGVLTVGITEESTVSVGTVEQCFDLDMSEYSVQSMESLFRGPMGQRQQSGGSSGRTLEVEAVYVSVGQQIHRGDALFKLTADSVEEIRQELVSDEEDAGLTYNTQLVQQQKAVEEASWQREQNQVYGSAASLEYEEALYELETSLTDARDALMDAQEMLTENQEELAEVQADYEEAKKYVKETTAAVESESDTYWYLKNEESREQAEKTAQEEEDRIRELQDDIQQQELEIVSLQKVYDEALCAYQTGEADARTQYDKRQYQLQQADEIYGIATDKIAYQTKTAKEDYEDASAKLQAFDAYIIDGVVSSEYDGIVTEAGLEAGDTVENGTQIMMLNNYGDITATVQVADEDMEYVSVGDTVKVSFEAFPEGSFGGTVADIGDASIASDSEISYAVEIAVSGDVEGLYEGMTGEVTFVTEETETVTYVSNRAIIREESASYVKLRREDGTVEKRQVVTGFSDGSNVEIREGLEAGETVLIESKVKSK